MSDLNPPGTGVSVRRYLYVFAAQLVITAMIVTASFIPFGDHTINIVVTLGLAACQAGLVLAFTMHLITEKRLIYGLLIFTLMFLIGLMYLTLSASAPGQRLHV